MLCISQDTGGGRRVGRLVLLPRWLRRSHRPGSSARRAPPGPQVNPCGLGPILVSTYLDWTPAPCPELPTVAQEEPPRHEKGETALPCILLAAVRGLPFPQAGDEDRALVCWKYWFVLQLCYWETKNCAWDLIIVIWFGVCLFVLNMDYYNFIIYALILVIWG